MSVTTCARGLLFPQPSLSEFVKALGRGNSANARGTNCLLLMPSSRVASDYIVDPKPTTIDPAQRSISRDTRFVCVLALGIIYPICGAFAPGGTKAEVGIYARIYIGHYKSLENQSTDVTGKGESGAIKKSR